jgi:N-acetyl-anhydromuramyl-L-alanine amidase AmpD
MDNVDGVVIHHSATTGQTLRSMAEFHSFVKGWQGLSYHYAVGWDGTVYLCNDVDRLTWHVENNNTRNIGIVLVGNLDRNPLPQAQRDAVRNLVYYLREIHGIHRVLPHRAFKATACPGFYAVDQLSTLWVDG